MKIAYDPTGDVLYISFKQTQVITNHWTDDVAADFDADGHLAGIEILGASHVLGDLKALKHIEFEQYQPTHSD